MTALDRPDAATPEEALARWRAGGDPADLARLFDLTAPDLFRLALHLVPDEASAEDALQETFLAVLLHGDRYEPGRPARPPPPTPGREESPEDPARKGNQFDFDPTIATATIRVRATVKGNLPTLRPIKFADAQCATLHAGEVLEQSILAKDGRLANVIAYVSKGAERWAYEPRRDAVVLDQRGCMYEPHVFTVQVNQPITVRNSDPTLHNIHAVPKKNDEWNRSQSKGAADFTEKFAKEEIGVRIKCDVHGWMQSFAGVFSHPFHGVTGDDGTVTLKVPAGEYEVSAWQESDKLVKPAPQKVAVSAGETKEVEFVYVTQVR